MTAAPGGSDAKAQPAPLPQHGSERGSVYRVTWAGFAALPMDGLLADGLQREVPDDSDVMRAREETQYRRTQAHKDRMRRRREYAQSRERAARVLQRSWRAAAHRSCWGRVGGLLVRAWRVRPTAQQRASVTIQAAARRVLERRARAAKVAARSARAAQLVAWVRVSLACGHTQETAAQYLEAAIAEHGEALRTLDPAAHAELMATRAAWQAAQEAEASHMLCDAGVVEQQERELAAIARFEAEMARADAEMELVAERAERRREKRRRRKERRRKNPLRQEDAWWRIVAESDRLTRAARAARKAAVKAAQRLARAEARRRQVARRFEAERYAVIAALFAARRAEVAAQAEAEAMAQANAQAKARKEAEAAEEAAAAAHAAWITRLHMAIWSALVNGTASAAELIQAARLLCKFAGQVALFETTGTGPGTGTGTGPGTWLGCSVDVGLCCYEDRFGHSLGPLEWPVDPSTLTHSTGRLSR